MSLPKRGLRTSVWTPRVFAHRLAALFITVSCLGSALGQEPAFELGPFAIDDEFPERSIPAPSEALKHPIEMGYLVMELAERGDTAGKAGNHEKAAHYYLAVGLAAPERAIGFSKACEEFLAGEKYSEAAKACKAATARKGATTADQVRFVEASLKSEKPLDAAAAADVDLVLAEMDKNAQGDAAGKERVAVMRCHLAVRLNDGDRLSRCVESLANKPMGDPQRFLFSSILAFKNKDWSRVQTLIADAERGGLSSDLVSRARQRLEEQRKAQRARTVNDFVSNWGPALGVASALGILGLALRRRRMKARLA